MTWSDLRLRVRALLYPRRVDRELDEELDFHLEMETRKQQAKGFSREDARARAQARFGSAAVAAEACRDARGITFIDTSLQDVIYAVRTLRRTPTIAVTIVGTIALGLGLIGAVFTIFNALVFRVEAVRDPGALVAVAWAPSGGSSGRFNFTRQQYETLRRENDVFTDVAARRLDISTVIDGRPMEAHLVTGNYFQMLGVSAALGRTLTPDDDLRPVERPAIVLSHRGWQQLTGSDPSVVGRSVLINGVSFDIVGVMPEEFRGLDFFPTDYWAPLSLIPQFRSWEQAGNPGNLEIIGRLKPGLSARTARAGLVVWASQGSAGLRANQRPETLRLYSKETATPLSTDLVLGFSPLFVAFGLILLIGCANVANLLLARGLARQREIGIRLSLGASRLRVVRQLVTESLLLALAAAAVAVGVARVILHRGADALMRTMPPELAEMARLAAPDADFRVAFFVLAVAVGATALFGLLPALQATRLDPVRAVRGDIIGDARPGRARSALIVVQVTASALLLICAGIFLRSALRAASVDPGLRTVDTIIIEFDDRARAAMVAAVAAEPLVAALTASWPGAPLLGEARPAFASADDGSPSVPVGYRLVTHNYFGVLDIDVVKGRVFTEAEANAKAAVAVVSEVFADQMWPHGNAIGRQLRLASDARGVRRDEPALPVTTFVVIGVVARVVGPALAVPEPGIYLPTGLLTSKAAIIARVHGDPEPTRRALLHRLTQIDPNIHLMVTMKTLGRVASYPLQVGFWITMLLGAVALVLTLSGLYALLSYLVVQRTNEIGVRMALGASTSDVIRLVLRQSLRVVTIGLAVGAGLAWGLATALMALPIASRISSLVDVFDGVAYSGTLLFIVAASLMAAAVPAFRAARIDPAMTLRHE